MKRKVKRYENGGDIEDDAVSLEQTGGFGRAAVQEAAKRPTYAASTTGQIDERDRREEAMAAMAKDRPAAKSPTFSQAFAAARKAGNNTFTFNGKKYTTEMKGEKKAAAPKVDSASTPAPAAPKSNRDLLRETESAMKGKSEEEAYRQRMKRLQSEQALQRVTPEEYLVGPAGALRGLHKLAKGMTAAKEGDKLRRYTQPALTNEPVKRLTNEPRKLTNEPLKLEMKKGGMVKASRRADGIAQRGKTRGRII
jgi:hypothetical protein